jgi:hypothetical protein
MWKRCSRTREKTIMALLILLVLLPAYAAGAGKILKIDPRHTADLQDMPSEITSMLEELGYEWQPVRDPVTGQPVRVIQQHGQYRMLFRATANASVQIDVHIRIGDNVTGLHLSGVDSDAPGYYHKLRERLELEFGADSVSDGSYLLTP